MTSTNIPSNEDVSKVRIQCKTSDQGQLDFDIDTSKFQELMTILVDCKYKTAGCITNDYLKDIKDHEECCLYRAIPCPVQSTEDTCEDILVLNLAEHVSEYHSSDYVSTEESFFSLPIDVDEEFILSKLVKICHDTLLFSAQIEDHKLYTGVLFIRNTNVYVNCKITIMADDVKWNQHKFQISKSNTKLDERAEQIVEFDLQKLKKAKELFSGISVKVDFTIASHQNIAPSDDFLQKITCYHCEDCLTSVYYQCEEKHKFCKTCYEFDNCIQTYGGENWCKHDGKEVIPAELDLCPINSLKKYEFPCINQSLGCKQYIPRFTSKHELLCPFGVTYCPVCRNSSVGYLAFIAHIKEIHTATNIRMLNTNVYGNALEQFDPCFMFTFDSVFFCKLFWLAQHYTVTIEWLYTSDIKNNFSFEVTFHYGYGEGIILKTDTDAQNINYIPSFSKSVYNTITKTATFKIYRRDKSPVKDITVTIHKQA